jgi:hypothetical protein
MRQVGKPDTRLDGENLVLFTHNVREYYQRVMREIYNRDPNTGEKLA